MKSKRPQVDLRFQECLASGGFRQTRQRQHVYNVLLGERDHPTAEQVFLRAKRHMPEISMATVYNCLDALVRCQLVREVNLDRMAMRYCPNMREHFHFHCDSCGGVFDMDYIEGSEESPLDLPKGFHASGYNISVRGLCPTCSGKQRKPAASKSVL